MPFKFISLLITVMILASCASPAPTRPEFDTAAYEQAIANAEAAGEDQDWVTSADYYLQAVEINPRSTEAHKGYRLNAENTVIYAEGDQMLSEEEQEQAVKKALDDVKAELQSKYQAWAEEDPGNAAVQWSLGQMYSYTDWDKVEEYTLNAIELDPNLSAAYQTMALISEVRGDNALQSEYLAKAVEASPDNPDYAFYYVMSFRRGDRSRYEPETLAFIDRFPGEERAAQALYWLAAESDTDAQKIEYLERLREEYPPADFSWSSSGMSKLVDLYAERDPAKALEIAAGELERADPEAHGGYMHRTWTAKVDFLNALIESQELMAAGDFAAAVEKLEPIETPRYGKADVLHTTRARALDGAGRTEEAYANLAEIAAEKPTDAVNQALYSYGMKLGKSAQEIAAEKQAALTARAEPLENFSFPRYDTGETVSLSDFRGKVVLMNFWYPFCGPCRGENPYLQKTLEKYGEDRFVILAINVHPDEDQFVMPYTTGNGFDFIPLKSDMEFAQKEFQARGMPTNFLLDVEGNKVLRLPPVHGDEVRTLELQIESLLPGYVEEAAVEAVMAQAEEAQSRQNWGEARDFYWQAIELERSNIEAHKSYSFMSGMAASDEVDQTLPEEEQTEAKKAASEANHERLVALYEDWAEEDPDNAIYQWALGQLYMYRDYDKMEQYMLRAIELDPKMSAAYGMLALLSEVKGDQAQQLDYLKKAADSSPDEASYAFYYASALRKSESYEYYREKAIEVAERFPEDERGAQSLYWLAYETEDVAEKTALYERLRSDFPPSEFGWSASGMSALFGLYIDSDPEKALQLAEELKRVAENDDPEGYAARMWGEMLDFEQKLQEAERLIASGDAAAAVELLEEVEQPRMVLSNKLHLTKARALEGADRTGDAYAYLLDIASEKPTDGLRQAAVEYGEMLGKNAQQVNTEIRDILVAKSEPLEDFSFERYDTGETVSLSDYRGKVVLMNFWYPFCGPCRGENPHLQDTLEKYGPEGFVILALNVEPKEDKFVMPYTTGNGFDFIPVRSSYEFAEEQFQARGMPTNILLDTDGNQVLRLPPISGPGVRTLELQVESLLPGKTES